ncbi:terminase small subunit (plasmid) [Skermanella rosea]|uniref:terminase small subunit n=1 Tax=Skermanella rosea TaxID=1817965 RepID=UPI00193459D2|nr:terminase small subunit [Skermanella rosea]UEM07397.1 terminase small subunit [Skermanella rosea]
MLDHSSPASAASVPPVIVLTPRQEAFCRAMASGVGGAEAARRAGYSPKGAKQRGAFLMTQPEIRVRIDQLRTDRQAGHQAALDRAAGLVDTIVGEALERKSLGLALRGVEFGLKLLGVIQDKRIPHHFLGDKPHPDADLETLDCDPEEDADHASPGQSAATDPVEPPDAPAMSPAEPAMSPAEPAVPLRSLPAGKPVAPQAIGRNSDLSARRIVTSPATAALFGSTSLSVPVPVPALRLPAVA